MCVVAGRLGLLHHRLHVPRRQELALLDVDRLAGIADVADEVGLPHQEGRGLQDVDDRGDFVQRGVFVDVGQDRHADLLLDLCQDLQALFQAGAAEAVAGGAVGLVEAGLEDEVHAQLAGDLLQATGHVQLQLHRLDHAWAGDQEQRLVQPYFETTQFHFDTPGNCAKNGPRTGRGPVLPCGTGLIWVRPGLPSTACRRPCARARHG